MNLVSNGGGGMVSSVQHLVSFKYQRVRHPGEAESEPGTEALFCRGMTGEAMGCRTLFKV